MPARQAGGQRGFARPPCPLPRGPASLVIDLQVVQAHGSGQGEHHSVAAGEWGHEKGGCGARWGAPSTGTVCVEGLWNVGGVDAVGL